MSNFHSNYKDIHKQIAIADFTDEQIQELITALQIKRSAKSKLTKEEKVFYQCCRERRSYAQNQDLDTVVCPICGSVKVIKNGTRNGRQRYFCKDCQKTFGDTNGTVAFRSKMSIGKWIEFIKLTLQGESCRTIAKNLRINKQTVLHNRYISCRCNYIWCNSLVLWKEEVSQFQLVELNSISHRRSKVDTPCSFSLGIHKK